jgi:catechol 2,3-dioxygenase-like lactoylglutathione lyase family enzyme
LGVLAAFSSAAYALAARRGARAASTAYSDDPAYKAKVASLFAKDRVFPSIPGGESPAVVALRYSCLGLAVENVEAAAAFYGKLGFERAADASALGGAPGAPPVPVLRSRLGLELHLLRAAAPLKDADGKPLNALMDVPAAQKGPGHTHASWSVPSVPAVKELMASLGVPLSGTRASLAIFVRDPDRTTLEFERNDGGDEPSPGPPGSSMIGFGRRLDHVGTRVRPPYDRHMTWYARMLGFSFLVNKYEANADPSKNMPPWVTRSPTGVDINLILNCSTPAPAEEGSESVLVAPGGALRPGIVYAGYDIADDAATALERLRAAGADAVLDAEAAAAPERWSGSLPRGAVCELARPSVFVRDLCGSVFRLTTAAST